MNNLDFDEIEKRTNFWFKVMGQAMALGIICWLVIIYYLKRGGV